MNDNIKIEGIYTIKCFENGTLKWIESFKNRVVQNYFTNLYKIMVGEVGVIELEDFATGDDSTPSTKNDTELGNELFRKNITVLNYNSTQVIARTVLAPGDSNFQIREIGIFATNGGMISRVNVDKLKLPAEQYEVEYRMTIV